MSHLLLLFVKYFLLCKIRKETFLVRRMCFVSFLVVASKSLNPAPIYSEISM